MPSTTPWRPVLSDSLRDRALETAHDIADALAPWASEELTHFSGEESETASLGSGCAGIALLHAYVFKDGGAAVDLLERAIGILSRQAMDPWLYYGFSGIAWAAHHVSERLGLAEDPCEPIDEILADRVMRSPWRGSYELFNGLVGLGVLAIERAPRPLAVACVQGVIDRLGELAEKSSEGITWFTPPELLPESTRAEAPEGWHCLGLAHGIPGVVGFLAAALEAGIARTTAGYLLEGTVDWLLHQRRELADGLQFPLYVGNGIGESHGQLSWCYGDLGVAVTILAASRATGNERWRREAVLIARRAASLSMELPSLMNSGLCHGSAGIAHMFNRVFQHAGDDACLSAARTWYERALDQRVPGRGIAGYAAWAPDQGGVPAWVPEPGLLLGASGVGLALLAGATNVEPRWDRVMLVS
ncbi:MAG: lanthionine synthetase C family protein [Deltaproteobacteria bacterium]|nr:lanthionine synthetase C family protein [Deltaproteobacteria bacterium]